MSNALSFGHGAVEMEDAAEGNAKFLLEGGTILVGAGGSLEGHIGSTTMRLHGNMETMHALEREGRARQTGRGFWTCARCPECGGAVIPGFTCCSEPYA